MKFLHENLEVFHFNTKPKRAYYIPYHNVNAALSMEREQSENFILLNGIWDFKYYDSFYNIEEEYKFKKQIKVPSNWEIEGYGQHQYLNNRYPIPYNPPFVPDDNPCGIYRKFVEVHDFQNVYINFEGVDSCFYLLVNQKFVGYSQVSHNNSEFDISEYLIDGKNEITVIVLKWCDGTYLESQDKLRMSGIFRDVYLLKRPKNHVENFIISQEFSNDFSTATINVKTDKPVNYRILEINREGKGINEFSETITNPLLWNAETPNLYTLVLEYNGEVIVQKIGLRKIEIKKSVLYINDKKIKIKGVNRHDSSPYRGYAVNNADMLKDLCLMKQHNVNAIRTSHYPNSPVFYEMCNKYGFYLFDEADIESHGVGELCENASINHIANDKRFTKAILDRVESMVVRDINQPCVIAWSMGNESGFGENFEEALKWTKEYDTGRITHYESAVCDLGDYVPDFKNLDVYSKMYEGYNDMEKYLKGEFSHETLGNKRPYIICEYSHAMGNGLGDLEDYQKVIYKYDNACGGFVWEWCDQGVYTGLEKGREKFFYGGDFGEEMHDGVYCMDGIVTPNREITTKLLEFKNVMRPVRCYIGDGGIYLENMMDFLNLKDYLYIEYEISKNGEILKTGILENVDIKPHCRKLYKLAGECITFFFKAKNGSPFIEKGCVLGHDQIRIETIKPLKTTINNNVKFDEDKRYIVANINNTRAVFDKIKGVFSSICCDNKEYFVAPMQYNIWRAPTDNDNGIKEQWLRAGYNRAFTKMYSCKIIDSCIVVKFSMVSNANRPIMDIVAEYSFDEDGRLHGNIKCIRNKEMVFLPRFGIRLFLDYHMENATYTGYGAGESYIDKCQNSYFGKFSATADEMFTDYIIPQENGARYGVEKLLITGEKKSMSFLAEKPYSFNLSHYTQEELFKKGHNFELNKSNYTILCFDYFNSGIGSGSCCTTLDSKYQLDDETFEFNFYLKVK